MNDLESITEPANGTLAQLFEQTTEENITDERQLQLHGIVMRADPPIPHPEQLRLLAGHNLADNAMTIGDLCRQLGDQALFTSESCVVTNHHPCMNTCSILLSALGLNTQHFVSAADADNDAHDLVVSSLTATGAQDTVFALMLIGARLQKIVSLRAGPLEEYADLALSRDQLHRILQVEEKSVVIFSCINFTTEQQRVLAASTCALHLYRCRMADHGNAFAGATTFAVTHLTVNENLIFNQQSLGAVLRQVSNSATCESMIIQEVALQEDVFQSIMNWFPDAGLSQTLHTIGLARVSVFPLHGNTLPTRRVKQLMQEALEPLFARAMSGLQNLIDYRCYGQALKYFFQLYSGEQDFIRVIIDPYGSPLRLGPGPTAERITVKLQGYLVTIVSAILEGQENASRTTSVPSVASTTLRSIDAVNPQAQAVASSSLRLDVVSSNTDEDGTL